MTIEKEKLLESEVDAIDSIGYVKRHTQKLESLIREIKRFHPENSTPTLFAELQQMYVGSLEQFIKSNEIRIRLVKLNHQLVRLHHGGAMGAYSREVMDELTRQFDADYQAHCEEAAGNGPLPDLDDEFR